MSNCISNYEIYDIDFFYLENKLNLFIDLKGYFKLGSFKNLVSLNFEYFWDAKFNKKYIQVVQL